MVVNNMPVLMDDDEAARDMFGGGDAAAQPSVADMVESIINETLTAKQQQQQQQQPKKRRKDTPPAVLPVYVGKHPRTFHDLMQLSVACETLTRNERKNLMDVLCQSLTPAEVALCGGTAPRRPVREIVRLLHYSGSLNPDLTREELVAAFAQLGVQRIVPTDRLMIKNPDMWFKYAPSDRCAWQLSNVQSDHLQNAGGCASALKGAACRSCVQAMIRANRSALWPELLRTNNAAAAAAAKGAAAAEAAAATGGGDDDAGGAAAAAAAAATAAAQPVPAKRKRKNEESVAVAAAAAAAAATTQKNDIAQPLPPISSEQSFVRRIPPIGRKNISSTDSPASPMDYDLSSSDEEDDMDDEDDEDDFAKNSN